MKVFKINSDVVGNTLIATTLKEAVNNLEILIEEMEEGETYTVSIGEMTDAQVANLKDFEGF